MPVDCLICGKPTSATHMGMDACRACTVFYRRNRDIGDKLLCINGHGACMEYENIFSCRKCRLDRFEAVMRAGNGEGFTDFGIATNASQTSHNPADFELFMQRIVKFDQPQSTIIDRIRTNHQVLSIFRRSEELRLRGMDPNSIEAMEERYEIVPSTYQYMNEAERILISAFIEFIPATFPEFLQLRKCEQWLLIRNYHKCFQFIDSSLRLGRRVRSGRPYVVFGSYTTCCSPETIDHFFSDCPDKSNIVEASETFRESFNKNVPKMRTLLLQIQPKEDEFFALIGLAFWSVENLELSDQVMSLATRYRTEIISELTAQYRCTIGEEMGTGRIGTLMALLQEYRTLEMALKSEYQIYHMLGAFDDETLTYQLQVRT